MDKHNMPSGFVNHKQWYHTTLKTVSSASAAMEYTYDTVIHGYSTMLTPDDVKSLEKKPGVLQVQQEHTYELHTTRSPGFLGIDKIDAMFSKLNISGENVIIGLLDTGVWPESRSYNDAGIGPIPCTWKGECVSAPNFNSSDCNRKLIGAKYFSKGYEALSMDEKRELTKSPRDDDGHGTNTSTIAAGSPVDGADLFGYASGRSRGVAMYKVCWSQHCAYSDVLAAMEAAIEDGVNIISISIGGTPVDYHQDFIAEGAFIALSRGIFVACSAGNSGPLNGTVENVALWITTVGAGTIDRDFPAYIVLGNGQNITGLSIHERSSLPGSFTPLAYAFDVTYSGLIYCKPGTMIPEKVAGKIVLCDKNEHFEIPPSFVLKDAGAAGMILIANENEDTDYLQAHILPAVDGHKTAGLIIKEYISSAANPVAIIKYGNTVLGLESSPKVATFSSRGPNKVTPGILKPDVLAPGAKILAGWARDIGPTQYEKDNRHVDYNILSGTSMSCPHVSGIAALLVAAHPEWSPAAVRSAIMTTSYSTYPNGLTIQDVATQAPSTPFDNGAGHVNTASALDPGLVYDASIEDYIDFLCALNYTPTMIKIVTQKNVTCDKDMVYRVGDLNYPSFAVSFKMASGQDGGNSTPTEVRYKRTLTNVGSPSTYKAFVHQVMYANQVLVDPMTLTFNKHNEKKTYTITFSYFEMPSGTTSFARLEWSDGKHIVSSPIAITSSFLFSHSLFFYFFLHPPRRIPSPTSSSSSHFGISSPPPLHAAGH